MGGWMEGGGDPAVNAQLSFVHTELIHLDAAACDVLEVTPGWQMKGEHIRLGKPRKRIRNFDTLTPVRTITASVN